MVQIKTIITLNKKKKFLIMTCYTVITNKQNLVPNIQKYPRKY